MLTGTHEVSDSYTNSKGCPAASSDMRPASKIAVAPAVVAIVGSEPLKSTGFASDALPENIRLFNKPFEQAHITIINTMSNHNALKVKTLVPSANCEFGHAWKVCVLTDFTHFVAPSTKASKLMYP